VAMSNRTKQDSSRASCTMLITLVCWSHKDAFSLYAMMLDFSVTTSQHYSVNENRLTKIDWFKVSFTNPD